jgi:hypothetical protein
LYTLITLRKLEKKLYCILSEQKVITSQIKKLRFILFRPEKYIFWSVWSKSRSPLILKKTGLGYKWKHMTPNRASLFGVGKKKRKRQNSRSCGKKSINLFGKINHTISSRWTWAPLIRGTQPCSEQLSITCFSLWSFNPWHTRLHINRTDSDFGVERQILNYFTDQFFFKYKY